MITWEYLIVALPAFEDDTVAMLMKRPKQDRRAAGGR
jgi:hypothetical protein